ncbi:Uncharacterised protein [Mycobacteroides abscessus subsp. abscessus]|nr:Uncharacterised protein [Mycobacteroides abscessus subsp. abscessus]
MVMVIDGSSRSVADAVCALSSSAVMRQRPPEAMGEPSAVAVGAVVVMMSPTPS